jgi:hypothetical protein
VLFSVIRDIGFVAHVVPSRNKSRRSSLVVIFLVPHVKVSICLVHKMMTLLSKKWSQMTNLIQHKKNMIV